MMQNSHQSTLVPAIEALAEELPAGRRRREMQQLARSLSDGSGSATSTAGPRSQSWIPVFAHSLATPSTAMRLSDWMDQVSRESHIRSRRNRVLIYPAVVFGLVILVFFGLGQMVVSPFIKMYDEFGLMLPAPTEFLFFWVKQWQHHTVRFVVYVVLIATAIYFFAMFWLRHALSTRLFGYFSGGNTANVAAMASFTGLLADLLASDVPLAESLELAGRGCGHRHFENVAKRLADHHRLGNTSLAKSPEAQCLPRNVIEALEPSDGAPPRTALLRELAAIYSEHAIERTEWSTGLMGAVAVSMVGLVVAFIVISLFMPLVSLISGLT